MNIAVKLETARVPCGNRSIIRAAPILETGLRVSALLRRGRGAIPRFLAWHLLRDSLYETRLPQGFTMLWDKASVDMLALLRAEGGWDENVRNALIKFLRPGQVLYDVGANAGYMSLSVAAAVPDARVYAFEPIPDLAQAIAASANANGFDRLEAFNAALSSCTSIIDLHLTTHTIHASMVARAEGARRLRVQAFALDELIAANALPPPHMIKIDVEGAEALVFEGGKKTLATHHPCLVFECDDNALRFGHSPKSILVMLQNLGYDSFEVFSKEDGNLIQCSDFTSSPYGDFVVSKLA